MAEAVAYKYAGYKERKHRHKIKTYKYTIQIGIFYCYDASFGRDLTLVDRTEGRSTLVDPN